jgi:hypothetical protein
LYFAAIVLFSRYAFEDIQDLKKKIGDLAFWLIVGTPIICILLFSMLPTFWRALRERRLRAVAIGGDTQFKPGYFRLHPYGAVDRDVFKRLDGADTTILNWLSQTDASVLYFSGASGSGKSSLLAANVLPTLRDRGWAVVEARLFGDPMAALRTAILDADGLFNRRPSATASLRELLERAAEARAKSKSPPVLLAIDQFEEFLILHREQDRSPFANLLSDLVKNPIEGFKLLLVFRSDYRPLVFKLELPPLEANKNWQDLAPYDRNEAAKFLQGGGRELSAQTLDELLRGLDRVEEARGIYRPITLNIVGLVLERMGRIVEGDPARLIQTYLTSCLTAGESRDFARPVLAQMITEAGTKEPRAEADLVSLTGFQPWQVKATLAELERQGLIRRLEGPAPIWEIAHDFLARTIGQMIGRLRPTLAQRARPLIAPAVLLGWIIAGALAIHVWQLQQNEATAEEGLRRLGASARWTQDGALSIDFPSAVEAAFEARSYLRRIRRPILITIDAFDPTGLHALDLELIRGLNNLRSLSVKESTGITSLDALKGLTNLSSLSLPGATGITSLDALRGLTNLFDLDLSGATGVTSLDALKGLTNLTILDLSRATGITSLEALKGLTNLTILNLSRATGITSLDALKGLTNLTFLDLTGATGITSLDALKALTNLRRLDLTGATGITSLAPLKGRDIGILGASTELLETMK